MIKVWTRLWLVNSCVHDETWRWSVSLAFVSRENNTGFSFYTGQTSFAMDIRQITCLLICFIFYVIIGAVVFMILESNEYSEKDRERSTLNLIRGERNLRLLANTNRPRPEVANRRVDFALTIVNINQIWASLQNAHLALTKITLISIIVKLFLKIAGKSEIQRANNNVMRKLLIVQIH